jgi:hypothetical protein
MEWIKSFFKKAKKVVGAATEATEELAEGTKDTIKNATEKIKPIVPKVSPPGVAKEGEGKTMTGGRRRSRRRGGKRRRTRRHA